MKRFTVILTIPFIIFTFISCGGTEKGSYDNNSSTIYEDAEDGTTKRWEIWEGFPVENIAIGADGSQRSIFVRENWLRDKNGNFIKDNNNRPINGAHYELPMKNFHQFILEFDKMKKRKPNGEENFCFTFGVKLLTKNGKRAISFNPFFDKENMQAIIQQWDDGNTKELVFPLSMKYVTQTALWQHLKFNLTDYLHKFEPDNTILEVTSFYFEGGDDYLDNIKLSSK